MKKRKPPDILANNSKDISVVVPAIVASGCGLKWAEDDIREVRRKGKPVLPKSRRGSAPKKPKPVLPKVGVQKPKAAVRGPMPGFKPPRLPGQRRPGGRRVR